MPSLQTEFSIQSVAKLHGFSPPDSLALHRDRLLSLRNKGKETSTDWRAQTSKQVNENLLSHPLSLSWVGELEGLWNANCTHLDEVRSRPRSLNDDSEEAALWTDSHSIWSPFDAGDPPESRATVAFTVDFAHFTDKEILASLKDWLKENRPKRWRLGLIDPALLLPRPRAEEESLRNDIDEVVKSCRNHSIDLLPFDEYWPDLWLTLGRELERLLSPRSKLSLLGLREKADTGKERH
ncbi:MAG: hypothetical protein ACLQU4_17500 [Limisphaerales bacterium]